MTAVYAHNDAERLGEAIDTVCAARSPMPADGGIYHYLNVVVAAAKAHLATLPKKTWKVRFYRSDNVFEAHEWPTGTEARIDAAEIVRWSDIVKVEIIAP